MSGPDMDAEVIALSARLLKRLGLKEVTLELNSLGGSEVRLRYREALLEFLLRHESSLDADSQRRVRSNPLRVLDAKSPQTQAILVDAPSIADSFDDGARAPFDGLQHSLTGLVQPFRIHSSEEPRVGKEGVNTCR